MQKKSDRPRRPGLPELAGRIIRAALNGVKPGRLIKSRVRLHGAILAVGPQSFDLNDFRRIHLISFGKAAPAMAEALVEILGDRVDKGVVTGRAPGGESRGSAGRQKGMGGRISAQHLTYIPASHPLPDANSVKAGRRAMALAGKAGKGDLVFVLISGGGSSMLCLPAPGISLEEKQWVTQALLRAGASITELNAVRKHLSAVKGGRLAAAIYPASIISLVISDVIGDDLESIASGPTHPDSTTFEKALGILKKYQLWESAPLPVRKTITEGIEGKIPETLKKDDLVFERVSNIIVGSNRLALEGAAAFAAKLGFEAHILTSADRGEARDAALEYLGLLRRVASGGRPDRLSFGGSRLSPLGLSPLPAASLRISPKPLCLLAGGELTVTVRGNGRGGRNTEFVLAALNELRREPFEAGRDWLIASVGTDGIDGPTDAAGAIITPAALERTAHPPLDPTPYLDDNDSYTYFEKAGGLIRTGPTGTNVMDLRIFLLKKRRGGCIRSSR